MDDIDPYRRCFVKVLSSVAAAIAVVIGLTAGVRAQAPRLVPVQGLLTDGQGNPVDGPVEVRFAIYPAQSGGNPLWEETQSVEVEQGIFAAYLGTGNPVDLALFRDHSDLWLGIRVASDSEMNRIHLGTTPFAGFAQHSSGGSIPSGAVMHFNLAECPPGWRPLQAAQGRVIVGLTTGGSLTATRGTPLSDLADQVINQVPEHSHAVSGASVDSTTGGAHTHTLNDPGHSHDVRACWGPGSGGCAGFWDSSGYPNSAMIDAGSGDPTGMTIEQSAGHNHSLDLSSLQTAATGAAEVPVTMPYVQLLACQKD